jgi:hypothetical protein
VRPRRTEEQGLADNRGLCEKRKHKRGAAAKQPSAPARFACACLVIRRFLYQMPLASKFLVYVQPQPLVQLPGCQ